MVLVRSPLTWARAGASSLGKSGCDDLLMSDLVIEIALVNPSLGPRGRSEVQEPLAHVAIERAT